MLELLGFLLKITAGITLLAIGWTTKESMWWAYLVLGGLIFGMSLNEIWNWLFG